MKWRVGIVITLLLVIVSVCLFGYVLNSPSGVFREIEAALLSLQWMLLVCIAIWCGSFIFLTFSLNDLPLIGLLLIAVAAYFISYAESQPATDAIVLLAGVMLGKGARFLLNEEGRMKNEEIEVGKRKAENGNLSEIANRKSQIANFLVGLVVLLAFSSWWHLDMVGNYHGPRWMGLWDNPNIYGMLMGAGVTLAIGLLAGMKKEELRMKKHEEKRKAESGKRKLSAVLFIAAGMMGVGLVFSYSRGAWVGTAVGLLYLAKAHGKLKWRFVLPGIFIVVAVVFFFWHSTADNAPWYLKRLDLSRPSAQHRVSAWRGALQMMRDHPLGVGWNKAVGIYDKNYSPPEGGAAAITMNSYLMLGTELGLAGLLCFVAYVGLSLTRKAESGKRKAEIVNGQLLQTETGGTHCPTLACRAGALMLLVAFWFDGGLFTLATASVFWTLMELSRIELFANGKWQSAPHPVS